MTYGLSGTLCAYKNERVNDVVKTDEDEVIGVLQSDNKSVRCDGRQGWCFSFWYSLPGRDEIIVPKQGNDSFNNKITLQPILSRIHKKVHLCNVYGASCSINLAQVDFTQLRQVL